MRPTGESVQVSQNLCVRHTEHCSIFAYSFFSPLSTLKSMAFQFSHCMRSTFELMRSQSLLCLLCMTSRRRFGNFSRFFFTHISIANCRRQRVSCGLTNNIVVCFSFFSILRVFCSNSNSLIV